MFGYANAQSIRRAQAPAAVPEAPAPAPDPAPVSAPAPAFEPARTSADILPKSEGQLPVSGVYQSSCGNFQVQGTGQTISYRTLLSVGDGVGRVQRLHYFFLSQDCSGSLYASYQFPVHNSQFLGQRATILPDNGQTVTGTLLLVQPAAGQVQLFGAAMQIPNNTRMVGVVVNGIFTAAIPIDYRMDEERFLLYATQTGLYMTHNREPGALIDSQGLPIRFLRGMSMARVR